ncbi:MAG TPA: cation transporter [Deltaproteobacteria bacterium]|nr:cation transporter [Deltaproteobacteria bacterium]
MANVEKRSEVYPECQWCAENVGKIAFWGNVGLFAVKLFCGIAGGSKALLADAIHSAVDVMTATVVMVCLRVSKTPPDEEHPFGHGQVEYITSLFIGLSLITVAIFILYSAAMDILRGVRTQPDIIALLGLIISIVGNELMFRQSVCCGEKFRSPAMIANAWENRADVYSSLAALVGVVGAQLGFLFMDRVGAILVAILISKSGLKMLKDAWHGILDRSLEEDLENQIRETAEADPDVLGVVMLKTRAIGQHRSVDMRCRVSPDKTLREGCVVAKRVEERLMKEIDNLGLVTISPTSDDHTEG